MSRDDLPDVSPVPLDAIVAMREAYRREMNCQIVHDSWHSHIPAARCNKANIASRLTLERAGMFPCARIVRGRIEG
jgi:hypothetical protein